VAGTPEQRPVERNSGPSPRPPRHLRHVNRPSPRRERTSTPPDPGTAGYRGRSHPLGHRMRHGHRVRKGLARSARAGERSPALPWRSTTEVTRRTLHAYRLIGVSEFVSRPLSRVDPDQRPALAAYRPNPNDLERESPTANKPAHRRRLLLVDRGEGGGESPGFCSPSATRFPARYAVR
jgi:hypothetical protein